jgi:hypothetical protein
MRSFTHYSSEKRDILQKKFQGTGYSREETQHGLPFNKHISVYDERLGRPDPFTQSLVQNRVRGKFAILDLASGQGQKFLAKAGGDTSRLNGMIERAGWSGYNNTASGMPQVIRLLHDTPTTNAIVTKNPFSTQHERTPDRRVGGSSMESTSIPAGGVTFDKPVRVVVSGKNGYRTRTAEDVVGINVGQKDIVFQRRYPGGRVIPSPYKHKNITNIKIRSSHSNPERNYFLP